MAKVATNAIRVNVAAYFDFLLLRVCQQKVCVERREEKKISVESNSENRDTYGIGN